MDLTTMEFLALGEHQNYKTKLVQKRWQQQRDDWLKNGSSSNVEEDPKNGKTSMPFPIDPQDNAEQWKIKKMAKKTMKSTTSPYAPFDCYEPLVDLIEIYMEIWYKDDSDSSSS